MDSAGGEKDQRTAYRVSVLFGRACITSLPSFLTLQGGRYDPPVVNLRTVTALYISEIEISRKFSINIFYGCPIDKSLHHAKRFPAKQGFSFRPINLLSA